MYAIETENIKKEYKGEIVLEHIDFQLKEGTICGIVGKNGTGKSVFLKMIAGLIIPNQGIIRIAGEELKKGEYAKDTGVLLDCTGFLPQYSAMENLLSLAQIRNVVGREEVAAIIDQVGLDSKSKKSYRKFSLGMKQKLAIAQAFMERPKLLLLDEPMNALDEDSVDDMRGMIKDYVEKTGASVLLTSHNKEDIETLCAKVYKIKRKNLEQIL